MVTFNFEQEFNNVLKKGLNMRMGQYCLKLFLKNFTKEGYLDGNGSFLKWKPLSTKYLDVKNKKYNGYPIGVATTKLKQSFEITYQSNGFKIENTAEYAEFFNEERPILYQSKAIDDEMIKYIDDEMNKLFQKHTKNLGNK